MTLRVMILGADGFIGGHLVRSLAASDWAEAVAAGRRPAPRDTSSQGATRVQLDATEERALESALHGIDAVVSCISGSPETIAASAVALFAAAARQSTPPRVVYLSSMAVYGAVRGAVTESAPLHGHTPYAQAKVAAEAAAAAYRSATILRPGIVYGPGSRQWTERIGRWLVARRVGDLGAAGDGCCNLVYVDDVVAAICRALNLDAATGQTFNLAMNAPPIWNEYFVRFAKALGAVPVATIGRRQLAIETRLLAPPLKIAEILSGKLHLAAHLPEPIPPSLLNVWTQDIRLDVSRAEQMLQLQWTDLDSGLRESVAWFNRQR
jgi:nucleoside-diphosphate-sugar epimerase